MRRGLGKQVEAEGAGTVKSDKSRLFEINKSGHNNYFGRKNEEAKSKKRINERTAFSCVIRFYSAIQKYFPCLYQELSLKQSSSI